MTLDKQTELLADMRTTADEGSYILGSTVYDRDGNFVAMVDTAQQLEKLKDDAEEET